MASHPGQFSISGLGSCTRREESLEARILPNGIEPALVGESAGVTVPHRQLAVRDLPLLRPESSRPQAHLGGYRERES